MSEKLKIMGIAGSLRGASYNRGALRAAQELAPADVQIDPFDLAGISVYNQDEEAKMPARVVEFKQRIKAADAILIATPEYNYSIPGVLKNAIDWGSRPYEDNSWEGKPVAIMGASPGMFGTARAQYHLRQVFVTLNMPAVNDPEVMIGQAQQRFDQHGNLTDAKSREKIAELLRALARLTRLLKPKE
jgi:chromate reductase